MTSVYEFQDESVEQATAANESEAIKRYYAVKEKLKFVWWSLREIQGAIYIIMDGADLDMKLKEFGSKKIMGRITEVKEEDYLCVKFIGCDKESKQSLALHDFCPSATELSKDIGNLTSTAEFCKKVTEKLQMTTHTSNTEEFEVTESLCNNTIDERISNDDAVTLDTSDAIHDNIYAKEARDKFVGEFNVPISRIKLATEERAVRELNLQHLADIHAGINLSVVNGLQLQIPPATGVIYEDYTNETVVELIDGNHTHHVMMQLSELYPERQDLQSRKIHVYKNLSGEAVSFLGLFRNEDTCNSLKTSNYDMIKVMRKVLKERFDGVFSNSYQQDIYQLFNAVCPGDEKEETKRKKRLQHFIRISTMEDRCWDLVERIQKKHPQQSMFSYREMSRLSVEQSLDILKRALEGRIRIADIKKQFKMCPSPSEDASLTLQRIRGDSKTERKRKSGASTADSIPTKVAVTDNGDGKCAGRTIPSDVGKSQDTSKALDVNTAQLNIRCTEMKTELERIENEKKALLDETTNLKRDLTKLIEKKKGLEEETKHLTATITKLKKEKEAVREPHKQLQTELLEMRKEKSELEEMTTHLKEEVVKIQTERNKLIEENTGLQKHLTDKKEELKKSKAEAKDLGIDDSMPFSLQVNGNGVPATDITVANDVQEKMAAVVEYTKERVYLGVLEGNYFIYCKSPLGRLEEGFKMSNSESSFVLNQKDKQKFGKSEKKYLICSFMCSISDSKLSLRNEIYKEISEKISQYLKDKK